MGTRNDKMDGRISGLTIRNQNIPTSTSSSSAVPDSTTTPRAKWIRIQVPVFDRGFPKCSNDCWLNSIPSRDSTDEEKKNGYIHIRLNLEQIENLTMMTGAGLLALWEYHQTSEFSIEPDTVCRFVGSILKHAKLPGTKKSCIEVYRFLVSLEKNSLCTNENENQQNAFKRTIERNDENDAVESKANRENEELILETVMEDDAIGSKANRENEELIVEMVRKDDEVGSKANRRNEELIVEMVRKDDEVGSKANRRNEDLILETVMEDDAIGAKANRENEELIVDNDIDDDGLKDGGICFYEKLALFAYRSIYIHNSFETISTTMFNFFKPTHGKKLYNRFQKQLIPNMARLCIPIYVKMGISRTTRVTINTNQKRYTLKSIEIDTNERDVLFCQKPALYLSNVAIEYILEFVLTPRTLPKESDLIGVQFWTKLKQKSVELSSLDACQLRDFFFTAILPQHIEACRTKFCWFRLITIGWIFNLKITPQVVNMVEEDLGISVTVDEKMGITGFSIYTDVKTAPGADVVETMTPPEKLYTIVNASDRSEKDDSKEEDNETEEGLARGAVHSKRDNSRFRFSGPDKLEMIDYILNKLKGENRSLSPRTDTFWNEYVKIKSEGILKNGRTSFPTSASCKKQFISTILPGMKSLPIGQKKREELLKLIENVSRKRKGEIVEGDAKRKKK